MDSGLFEVPTVILECFPNDLSQVDDLASEHHPLACDPSDVEQVVDQAPEVIDLPSDDATRSDSSLRSLGAPFHDVETRLYRRQRVSELV